MRTVEQRQFRNNNPEDPWGQEDWQHMPGKLVYWLPLASFADRELILERGKEVLQWLCNNVTQDWLWCIRANDTSCNDIIHELWISFDSADDAMLSKLTWMDLRSKEHAEY